LNRKVAAESDTVVRNESKVPLVEGNAGDAFLLHAGRKPYADSSQAELKAGQLQTFARALLILAVCAAAFGAIFFGIYLKLGRPWQWAWMILAVVQAEVLLSLAYILVRHGHLTAAVYLATFALNISALIATTVIEGYLVSALLVSFIVIAVARLVGNRAQNRGVVLVSGVALVAEIWLASLRPFDPLPTPWEAQLALAMVSAVAAISVAASILDLRDKQYEDALARVETYAADLARRARYMEATAEVARATASVLDLEELLAQVAALIGGRFGFYRTGVFLLDHARKWAVLRATAVDGRSASTLERRLPLGEDNLVSRAINRQEPLTLLDVDGERVFGPPGLPDTRSAIALPLRVKEEIIGVLDAHSKEPEAFGHEDVAVLQTMADQVAVAIENARLYESVQRELAEREQAEEALRESERRYRSLFEDSPVSLWEEDFSEVKAYLDSLRAAGVRDFRTYFDEHPETIAHCVMLVKVIDVNEATLRMYQAVGKAEFFRKLDIVLGEESDGVLKEELIAIAEGRTVFESEAINHTLTGDRKHIVLTWQVAPGCERTWSKVLVSVVDISDRKWAEEMLAGQAQELARSNAELRQFAYIASHHLQEPLRMVVSYAQLLEQRYGEKLGADADEFIGYVTYGAKRMRNLVHDLSAYAQLDARSRNFASIDCEIIFNDVLSGLRATIEESEVAVTHDPLPMVVADAAQLGLVFHNLIENAVKFRNEEPPRIHVSARQDGKNGWVFSVCDNGMGVAPQQTERIFEIFQRPHNWTEYPGTGIGLAVCKKIVERHGGRIWVESEPGQGSTFHFTIPDKGDQPQTL
jgi:signal transduction histidine kinase/putative methionine-R-sulfoxide reductase with GAF domain